MASQDTSRYHLAPSHEEDEVEYTPSDSLLPSLSPKISLYNFKTTWSITLDPILVVRGLSLILSLVAFIIFIIDGGSEFIAADIFLGVIMAMNVMMLVHYTVSHLVKVTVEVRQNKYALENQKKPKVSTFVDLFLAAALTLALLIGNAVKSNNSWRRHGAWAAAVIIGYFVVLMQVLIVLPGLETKSLTITFKLNDRQGKDVLDTKLPSHHATASSGVDIGGAARRRTPEAETPSSTAEDLV